MTVPIIVLKTECGILLYRYYVVVTINVGSLKILWFRIFEEKFHSVSLVPMML